MKVKFWGVRGSIPCPGPETAKYGGDTPCIQVIDDNEDIIILDAGSGIRELGLELAKSESPIKIHLLITHSHWDHIQGFPFFKPLLMPKNEIYIYGPKILEKSVEELILIQMQTPYFPLREAEISATLHFQSIGEGSFKIGGFNIETIKMNHPIDVLAYKLTNGKRTITYTGDNEPYYNISVDKGPTGYTHTDMGADTIITLSNNKVVNFVAGSNLLIADAQYTDEEYKEKRGWGHSTINQAIQLAINGKVKKLALFHHEPTRTDKDLKSIEDEIKKEIKQKVKPLRIFFAREDKEIKV